MTTTLTLAVGVSCTVAVADFVGSATLVAVMVTVCGELIEAGAVYRPLTSVPTAGFIDQVTAVFVLPVTVAVNCEVCEADRFALGGLSATLTPGSGAGVEDAADSVTTPWDPRDKTWLVASRYKTW